MQLLGGLESTPQRGSAELSGGSTTSCGGSKHPTPVKYSPANLAQNSGTIAPSSLDFLTEVGRRLSAATSDARETTFLFQRISVALQQFNAVLIHESFVTPDVEPDL